MIPPDQFRMAMGKFATGVAVVSSLEADGSVHGMTANSITSVSLEPPLVLVCIAHERNTYHNVRKQDRFGINILAEHQMPIARYFARDPQDRAGDVPVPWHAQDGGSPQMEGALAFLDCRVVAHYDHGDHAIVVAEVVVASAGDGQPLLFYERQLRGIDGGG